MAICSGVKKHVAAVVVAGGAVLLAEAQDGLSTCRCINPYSYAPVFNGARGFNTALVNGKVRYQPPGSTKTFDFIAGWGNGCKAHDQGQEPYCGASVSPGWCKAPWCYVDREKCTGAVAVKSKWLPQIDNLYFSYATCAGSGNSGSTEPWNDESVQMTKRVVSLVNNYVRGANMVLEKAYVDNDDNAQCPIPDSLNMKLCLGCAPSSTWGQSVDFFDVGILAAPSGGSATSQERAHAVCMAEEVAQTYKAVAAERMDPDFTKIGYEYFGEAKTGGYAQWPKVNASSWNDGYGGVYDPRFRPWYASGATGPKDVLILVDVSGSMDTARRHEKAQAATMRILDTLTWKDFVSVVLFDGRIEAIYKQDGRELMVPATEANKQNIKNWCKQQDWKGGLTNFRMAFEEAFRIMKDSVMAKRTSMCQKALMFLTDGEDNDFSDSHYAYVRQKVVEQDVTIFSYAIGDGADDTVAKRLACENRGVFYKVSDSDDLAEIMSKYFEFFIQGQEVCSTSFVKYAAAGNGQTLRSACMPMYDRTKDTERSLLGVSCLDVDLIEKVSDLQQQSGWNHFVCQASDMTKQCRTLDLSECNLQKIRMKVGLDSVCDVTAEQKAVTANTECACINPTCQDDAMFIDAKGYFCDQWVGDSCNDEAGAAWQFTAADMAAIRSKCKRSCGLCDWVKPCPKATPGECGTGEVQSECRACLGQTSGFDLEGNCMACPPDAPRNLMKGKEGCSCLDPDCKASASSARVASQTSAAFAVSLLTWALLTSSLR